METLFGYYAGCFYVLWKHCRIAISTRIPITAHFLAKKRLCQYFLSSAKQDCRMFEEIDVRAISRKNFARIGWGSVLSDKKKTLNSITVQCDSLQAKLEDLEKSWLSFTWCELWANEKKKVSRFLLLSCSFSQVISNASEFQFKSFQARSFSILPINNYIFW